MLLLTAHRGHRHDVGGRVDRRSMMHRTVHDIVGRFEIEGLPGDRAVLCFEQFPSLNFVEDLEEEGPENDFSRIGRSRAVILDFTDQVLADGVGSWKAFGETHGSWDGIVYE